MLNTRKLAPGQKGTKKLHEQFGDRLLCVRYRYDDHLRKRFKTVELIVEETAWTPPATLFAANTICNGEWTGDAMGCRIWPCYTQIVIGKSINKVGNFRNRVP